MADAPVDVLVVRLDPGLAAPAYAHPGDAGADLRARHGVELAPRGGRSAVATGLAVAIPEGFVGLVVPRSGLAARHGVTCLNTPGVVDAGYRGELMVVLVNTDPDTPYQVARGDRIAQLVIQTVVAARFVEVDEAHLPSSRRGAGRFGSSGT